MATQQQEQPAAAAATQHTAQVVGNAFVQQYYHILHQSPELVYRFYQETSKLGRPEDEGVMRSITSMQEINEKILSLEYGKYKAGIKTVDAQESLDRGVLVLVTGYLSREDGVKRNFTQSFFLAPQDKGYFVLNDILRYTETDSQQGSQGHPDGSGTATPRQDIPTHDEQQVPEQSVPPEEEEEIKLEEVYNPSDDDEGSVLDEEIPTENVVHEVPNSSHVEVEQTPTTALEEAPKKSYASIVKVMKGNIAPIPTPALNTVKPVPANQDWLVNPAQAPSLASDSATSSFKTSDSGAAQEADGFSIYIKNLPLNATPAQLEEEFKRFGPIKSGGIQVRSHKHGFCFGFVEFEVPSAVQSAIEASPIMIGGHQAYVEEKRPTGSRVSSRGRFMPGRGFRSDGARGRGNYGGGRGFGRGDFNNRADFGNRGGGRGGSINRGEGGYQRVENGACVNRPGGLAADAPSKDSLHWAPTS